MIYIVSHKPIALPNMEGYQPIQVGNAKEAFSGFIRDDTGDNIADKNASFCELTALYWVWKNADDDFKGLVHYRRFFGHRAMSSDVKDVLSYDALRDLLRDRDIVLARPAVYHVNARDQLLMNNCSPEVFDRLRRAVMDLSPKYLGAFNAFFEGNRAAQYNMMFCDGTLFDTYCAWLFPILFRVEEEVDLSGLDDYRRRLFGFLSERLLNVWVIHNGLRTKYVPVVSTEYTRRDHWTYLRRDITNGLRFRLGRSGDK